MLVYAAQNHAIFALAVVKGKFEQFFGLGNRLARKHFHRSEIGLGKRFKIHRIFEDRLDFDVGEIDLLDLFLFFDRLGFCFRFLLCLADWFHCGEQKHVSY